MVLFGSRGVVTYSAIVVCAGVFGTGVPVGASGLSEDGPRCVAPQPGGGGVLIEGDAVSVLSDLHVDLLVGCKIGFWLDGAALGSSSDSDTGDDGSDSEPGTGAPVLWRFVVDGGDPIEVMSDRTGSATDPSIEHQFENAGLVTMEVEVGGELVVSGSVGIVGVHTVGVPGDESDRNDPDGAGDLDDGGDVNDLELEPIITDRDGSSGPGESPIEEVPADNGADIDSLIDQDLPEGSSSGLIDDPQADEEPADGDGSTGAPSTSEAILPDRRRREDYETDDEPLTDDELRQLLLEANANEPRNPNAMIFAARVCPDCSAEELENIADRIDEFFDVDLIVDPYAEINFSNPFFNQRFQDEVLNDPSTFGRWSSGLGTGFYEPALVEKLRDANDELQRNEAAYDGAVAICPWCTPEQLERIADRIDEYIDVDLAAWDLLGRLGDRPMIEFSDPRLNEAFEVWLNHPLTPGRWAGEVPVDLEEVFLPGYDGEVPSPIEVLDSLLDSGAIDVGAYRYLVSRLNDPDFYAKFEAIIDAGGGTFIDLNPGGERYDAVLHLPPEQQRELLNEGFGARGNDLETFLAGPTPEQLVVLDALANGHYEGFRAFFVNWIQDRYPQLGLQVYEYGYSEGFFWTWDGRIIRGDEYQPWLAQLTNLLGNEADRDGIGPVDVEDEDAYSGQAAQAAHDRDPGTLVQDFLDPDGYGEGYFIDWDEAGGFNPDIANILGVSEDIRSEDIDDLVEIDHGLGSVHVIRAIDPSFLDGATAISLNDPGAVLDLPPGDSVAVVAYSDDAQVNLNTGEGLVFISSSDGALFSTNGGTPEIIFGGTDPIFGAIGRENGKTWTRIINNTILEDYDFVFTGRDGGSGPQTLINNGELINGHLETNEEDDTLLNYGATTGNVNLFGDGHDRVVNQPGSTSSNDLFDLQDGNDFAGFFGESDSATVLFGGENDTGIVTGDFPNDVRFDDSERSHIDEIGTSGTYGPAEDQDTIIFRPPTNGGQWVDNGDGTYSSLDANGNTVSVATQTGGDDIEIVKIESEDQTISINLKDIEPEKRNASFWEELWDGFVEFVLSEAAGGSVNYDGQDVTLNVNTSTAGDIEIVSYEVSQPEETITVYDPETGEPRQVDADDDLLDTDDTIETGLYIDPNTGAILTAEEVSSFLDPNGEATPDGTSSSLDSYEELGLVPVSSIDETQSLFLINPDGGDQPVVVDAATAEGRLYLQEERNAAINEAAWNVHTDLGEINDELAELGLGTVDVIFSQVNGNNQSHRGGRDTTGDFVDAETIATVEQANEIAQRYGYDTIFDLQVQANSAAEFYLNAQRVPEESTRDLNNDPYTPDELAGVVSTGQRTLEERLPIEITPDRITPYSYDRLLESGAAEIDSTDIGGQFDGDGRVRQTLYLEDSFVGGFHFRQAGGGDIPENASQSFKDGAFYGTIDAAGDAAKSITVIGANTLNPGKITFTPQGIQTEGSAPATTGRESIDTFRSGGGTVYVDQNGRPVPPPTGTPRLVVPSISESGLPIPANDAFNPGLTNPSPGTPGITGNTNGSGVPPAITGSTAITPFPDDAFVARPATDVGDGTLVDFEPMAVEPILQLEGSPEFPAIEGSPDLPAIEATPNSPEPNPEGAAYLNFALENRPRGSRWNNKNVGGGTFNLSVQDENGEQAEYNENIIAVSGSAAPSEASLSDSLLNTDSFNVGNLDSPLTPNITIGRTQPSGDRAKPNNTRIVEASNANHSEIGTANFFLNDLTDRYGIDWSNGPRPDITGDITIVTERTACLGCRQTVVGDLQELLPNVNINLYEGNIGGVESNPVYEITPSDEEAFRDSQE